MGYLKHSVRQLGKHAGASALTIFLLAVGIGSTTAMFSLYHTILLRPLPVAEPEQLVNFVAPGVYWGSYVTSGAGGPEQVFSYAMFRDLESEQSAFAGIAGHRSFGANIAEGGQAISGIGMLVSGSYFDVLGLTPELGRFIAPSDDEGIGQSRVAVLSHEYWQTAYGGDPDVIGETLEINGQRLEIIGIGPGGFTGTTLGTRAQVFVPLSLRWLMQPTEPMNAENRALYWVYLFARLQPGVSQAQATAEINGLYRGMLRDVEAPTTNFQGEVLERFLEREIVLAPGARGQSMVPGDTRLSLTFLLGLTVLVLVIVCVNVANLMLVRGTARSGELAVRASLGAGRGRLIEQLLAEAAGLALVGGLFAMPVAALTLQLLSAMTPARLASGLAIELNAQALIFACAATLSTVLAFGLLPAIRASTIDLNRLVRGYSTSLLGGSGSGTRLRTSLATIQVAFSTVLLVLAGLFASSLIRISSVDLGMVVDPIVQFGVSPRLSAYTPERTRLVFDEIEAALAAQPGVSAVTSANVPLLGGVNRYNLMSIDGFEPGPGASSIAARNWVSPTFFETMSIPLLAGRAFTDAETFGTSKVAVINESFLKQFDLGADVIGQRIGTTGPRGDEEFEVIGVVADSQYSNVKDDIPGQFFVPRRQFDDLATMNYYVRSDLPADVVAPMIRGVVENVGRDLPIVGLGPLSQTIRENVYRDRMLSMLSAGFAGLAVLLAVVGLYGVITYAVLQRTREFGLRLALGATPATLRFIVFRSAAVITIAGVSLGVLGALPLGGIAESLLFGLTGRDAGMMVAAAVALAVATFVAALLPARRAARIAPMVALREE